MKFFKYDTVNEKIVLNDEHILLTKEFKALMNPVRNKCPEDKTGKKKLKAFKELTFIYLFFDWESPYFQYTELEKEKEVLLDSGLDPKEYNNSVFREACRKYEEVQNSSKVGQLLKASYATIDKITHYLNTLDLDERDPATGKPIFKTKDVIAEIGSASKLIDALKTLEIQFKKEAEIDSSLRGDKQPGLFDRG